MGLTFAIATELAAAGVTSNAIAPAASTRMSEASRADFEQMLADGVIDDAIWQRFLSLPGPEFTSPVVSYLASDAAAGITGRVFATGFGVSVFKLAAETPMTTKDQARGPFTFRGAGRDHPGRRPSRPVRARACSGSFPTNAAPRSPATARRLRP